MVNLSIQGDTRFAFVMEQMGARVEWDVDSITLTGTFLTFVPLSHSLLDLTSLLTFSLILIC